MMPKSIDSGREASAGNASESSDARAGVAGKKKRQAGESLQEELERAADGLYYQSESDYPYKFFYLPVENKEEFTPQGFLASFGISDMLLDELQVSADKLIEELPFDGFFPDDESLADRRGTDTSDHRVVSEYKRYQKLEAVLRKRLKELKVYRVGRVEIHTFIVGLDEHGNFAGLMTIAVET